MSYVFGTLGISRKILLLRLYELRREEKLRKTRVFSKNRNLEAVANVMIQEEKRRGSYEAFPKMVRGIRA